VDPVPRPHVAPVALGALLQAVPSGAVIHGSPATGIGGVELDSRLIRQGDLFAALAGHREHGIIHAPEAVRNGAAALLTDDQGWAAWQSDEGFAAGIPVLVIEQAREWLGLVAEAIYSGGLEQLQLVGVTGTNGKTTVASMVEAGMRAAGMSTGFIGTTGVRIGTQAIDSVRTTPESTTIHALLAAMREQGVQGAAMEVSSHAMVEHRVGGLRFAAVGFTNLTQDHLDFHGTMESYFQAKSRLFTAEHADFAAICIDDHWGEQLAASTVIPKATVSISGKTADWTVQFDQARGWMVQAPDGRRASLALELPGSFNRANAALAIALLDRIGVPLATSTAALSRVHVPGRLEPVLAGSAGVGISGFVDYAHTPDAIGRVIAAVRELTEGHIIAVVGAGGDRDSAKRPLMGAMAARLADQVIVTDDNPRSEDPAAIRAAVLEGARTLAAVNGAMVLDVGPRKEAIQRAVELAAPGDVVLVLGKGHEQGQEVAGVVMPFDDRLVLAQALADRASSQR